MARTYRIRDTQRFLFLALLFPLMPLLLAVIHPSWTPYLFACEVCFVVFTFWMLLRTRDLTIDDDAVRLGRGYWQQIYSPDDLHDITLTPHQGIVFRTDNRPRYIRIMPPDAEQAVQAMLFFASRHQIPVHDKRTRRDFGKGKGRAM